MSSRLSTSLDNPYTSVNTFDNNVENTIDSFGKLRVTNPITLLDIRFPGQSVGSDNFLSNNLQVCSLLGYSDSSGGIPTGIYQNSKLYIQIPFTPFLI
jgi:hypothetical protein